jgi:hypothetical protein
MPTVAFMTGMADRPGAGPSADEALGRIIHMAMWDHGIKQIDFAPKLGKKILATLIGLAVLSIAAPASAHTHPGWQHNPRNPHYVKVVPTPRPTPTGCTWVQTGTIGSVPHLVCGTR